MSPSSQRVWIEIELLLPTSGKESGRPLHRGCGLKLRGTFFICHHQKSPSSQRVWIEIDCLILVDEIMLVALFTEGVD